jgi:hypothetical protein
VRAAVQRTSNGIRVAAVLTLKPWTPIDRSCQQPITDCRQVFSRIEMRCTRYWRMRGGYPWFACTHGERQVLTRSHYRENAFHVGKLNCTFRDAAQKASADYATSAARRGAQNCRADKCFQSTCWIKWDEGLGHSFFGDRAIKCGVEFRQSDRQPL